MQIIDESDDFNHTSVMVRRAAQVALNRINH